MTRGGGGGGEGEGVPSHPIPYSIPSACSPLLEWILTAKLEGFCFSIVLRTMNE